MSNVLTIVLAGGKGDRLQPLTQDRAKPAVPFGGVYRIIDFALSNCINSELRQILVMTQYKSQSLQRHLRLAWSGFRSEWNEFLEVVPPQQRLDDRWYEGTADAVYQNIYAIEQSGAEQVLILSGDHVYKMDYRDLLNDHMARHSDATIACIPVPLRDGSSFGIMGIDGQNRVTSFSEKPSHPTPMPDDPRRCLASMGVYVFRTQFLLEQLTQDGCDDESRHDFGRNIVPKIIATNRVRAYPFVDMNGGARAYWRDVGTIDAYFYAHRDLLTNQPAIELNDQRWRIHGHMPCMPPALFKSPMSDSDDSHRNRITNSLISPGVLISDASVHRSVISPNVHIDGATTIEDSILLDGVHVGAGSTIRRAIIDKGVWVPAGIEIGDDRADDEARGFTLSESGIVVVPKGYRFESESSRNCSHVLRTSFFE